MAWPDGSAISFRKESCARVRCRNAPSARLTERALAAVIVHWSSEPTTTPSVGIQKSVVVPSRSSASPSTRSGQSLTVMSQKRIPVCWAENPQYVMRWTVMPMARVFRISAHAALFVAALFVFFFGLGVGLAHSPLYGSLLWVAAGVICVGNLWWMIKGSKRG